MKKILFVDHVFHKRTKSSAFFQDLLASQFRVETLHVDPLEGLPPDYTAPADADVVVLWQMDYLAPLFLRLGMPTIVVPMYDGSGQMPRSHWRLSAEASFISFSFALHERIQRAGGQSLLVKYFPEVPEAAVEDFSSLHGFIWQRAPQTNINWKFVNHVIGHQLASLHIHDAPDECLPDRTWTVDGQLAYPVTVSTWFEDQSELDAILQRCNVYIAPRPSEGIGMAFLEAMARGCCVLAQDLPTHNEYIMNWVSGILFNKDATGPFTISDPAQIGRWARQAAIEGRAQWLQRDCGRILDFIDVAAKPKRSMSALDYRRIDRLVHCYNRSHEDYLSFLNSSEEVIEAIAGPEDASRQGQARAEVFNRFLDFSKEADVAAAVAFSMAAVGGDGLWTSARSAELHIAHRSAPQDACLVLLDLMAPPGAPHPVQVRIEINGEGVGCVELAPNGPVKRVRYVLPRAVRGDRVMRVRLISDYLVAATGGESGGQSLRGIGVSSIGLFDMDHVPIRDVTALEHDVRHWIGDPGQRREFVSWCLEKGIAPDSGDAVAKFDPKLVGPFIAAEILANPGAENTQRIEAIWSARRKRRSRVLGEVPVHDLMHQVLTRRPDVAGAFDLGTEQGLASFLGWYYLIGAREYGLAGNLHQAEIAWLGARCLPTTDASLPGLSRITYCLWCMREDLQDAFDLATAEGRDGLARWAYTHGTGEHDLLEPFLSGTAMNHGRRDRPQLQAACA